MHGLLHINDMAEATVKMVTASVDAFVKGNLQLAEKVMEDDDIVDSLFNQIKDELICMIQEKRIEAESALDLLMAAKYLERIGDHAVNLAEWGGIFTQRSTVSSAESVVNYRGQEEKWKQTAVFPAAGRHVWLDRERRREMRLK